MLNIFNRSVFNVKEQIDKFLIHDNGHQAIGVHFFGEYTDLKDASLENYPLLNQYEQQLYIDFLAKYSARIRHVEISINFDEDEPPYGFLGQCLSQLKQVQKITLNCPKDDEDEDDEPYQFFTDLGNTLKKLGSLEHIKALDFDVEALFNQQGTYDQGSEAFVHFIRNCVHLQSFKIRSFWMSDYEVFSGIYDALIDNKNMKEADFTLRFFDFEDLKRLFTSKSIENLRIKFCGLGDFGGADGILIPPHIQLADFLKDFPIFSALKHLSLDFHDISFTDFERKNYVLSCDTFIRLSQNKSLESLELRMPSFYTKFNHHRLKSEREKWQAFVINFRESNLCNLNLPQNFFHPGDLDLVNQVTSENKRALSELASFSPILTGHLHPYFNGSFFQNTSITRLKQLDQRLCRVNLIQDHLNLLHNRNALTEINSRFYIHFSIRVFSILTDIPNYDATFAPLFMSFINPRDFLIILKLSFETRATLQGLQHTYQYAMKTP